MKIAFFGLGNMGLPMAKNLCKAGHTVHGYDPVAEACEQFAAAGGQKMGDFAPVLEQAELVLSMLPEGRHVRQLYTETVLPQVAAGCRLVDCSTIEVSTAREVAALAAQQGLAMLDAPVSGGVAGAAAGTLTFMVGGDAGAFAALKPVFEAMGKTIIHTGEAGAGQAVKVCNNLMLAIQMLSVCEGFNLAQSLGVDAGKLFEVSSKASGQCWSLINYCPVPGLVPAAPSNRNFTPGFTAAFMLKDLKLAADAAASTGTQTPMGRQAVDQYTRFCASGEGSTDFSGIIKMLSSSSSE